MASLVFDLSLYNKSIQKKWLYKDIATDLKISKNKRDIEADYDISAIENSIYNMFLFAKAERILIPEFGNNLYAFLYEPINKLTAYRIGQAIKDMFILWEPRVDIINVIVTPLYDENTYYIVVEYTIPTLSNETLEFVYAINARR